MRALLIAAAALVLVGCAGLPKPDPGQAWIDLHGPEDNSLQALEVDDRSLEDDRYFQVPPGSHQLTMRLQFPVAPSNIGPGAQPLWRDCQMNLSFNRFDAGQRYRIEAGNTGFHPWARLYDAQRNLIGRGDPTGCQRA